MYRLNDLDYMREALRLAAEGVGQASPNPLVGAVVVQDGEIVGRGTHRYEEAMHAEVLALQQAGEQARGATLYVNLEPCCHTGRTPPCTEVVMAAGVARVVAAIEDPNPKVAGQGLRKLAAAGIKVECGCLGREGGRLNEDFSKWIRTGLPWVTLKAAISLDGRIAPAQDSTDALRHISSTPSRERVQQLRHRADALLTGIGTALADDPLLTDRSKRPRRRRLLRVVLDSTLRLPVTSQLVTTCKRKHDLLALHTRGTMARAAELEQAGVRVEQVADDGHGRVSLGAALRRLGELEMLSVLVEGGAEVNGAMLAGGWCDKLILFQAPLLLGASGVPLAGGRLDVRLPEGMSVEPVGPDLMIEAILK